MVAKFLLRLNKAFNHTTTPDVGATITPILQSKKAKQKERPHFPKFTAMQRGRKPRPSGSEFCPPLSCHAVWILSPNWPLETLSQQPPPAGKLFGEAMPWGT